MFSLCTESTVRIDDDDGGSDHRVLQAQFMFPPTVLEEEKAVPYLRLRLHKLQFQDTALKYQQTVDRKLAANVTEHLEVNNLNDIIVHSILEAAKEVLGHKKIKPRCPKLHTRELQAARRKRRAAYKSMQFITAEASPERRSQRWNNYVEARTAERRE